ncbi:MAG: hypothetical protein GF408_01655 [Candidatus Omnitrophica bacterium]|nr:hypothetical protein [Candidatus Omnitrophota bacterium]
MIFDWESRKEQIKRRAGISPLKKLESLRAMNEMSDIVLTPRQKKMRRKIRESRK